MSRLRMVIDVERYRWYTDEEFANLAQSILRKELGVKDLDVEVEHTCQVDECRGYDCLSAFDQRRLDAMTERNDARRKGDSDA